MGVIPLFGLGQSGPVVVTDSNFAQIQTAPKAVVDFWVPTCPPCVTYKPVFEEVAAEASGVVMATANTNDAPAVSGQIVGAAEADDPAAADDDGFRLAHVQVISPGAAEVAAVVRLLSSRVTAAATCNSAFIESPMQMGQSDRSAVSTPPSHGPCPR